MVPLKHYRNLLLSSQEKFSIFSDFFSIYLYFNIKYIIIFVYRIIFYTYVRGGIMKLERKFFLRIIDDQQKEIFTYNKGNTLNYQEVKKHILDELQNIEPVLYQGDFYICIICESGELYQCIQYKWLFAQYAFDTSKSKKAFLSLLDFLFIYGEWTNFYKIPKKMVEELNQKIQKTKEEYKSGKTFKWSGNIDTTKINKDTILNGKPLSYWEEKQKEYDKQRLELINKGIK